MATTPPVNPQYPIQPQMGVPPPPPKKKMGPLGWILIGCGGIVVLGVLVVIGLGLFAMHKAKQAGVDLDLMKSNPGLAAAKIVVAANPDLTVISEDDDRGIIRVHDSKQNRNFVVNFEDAKKGKLTLQEEGKEAVTLSSSGDGSNPTFEAKTADGSVTIGGGAPATLPSWMPSYPNSQPQNIMSGNTVQARTAQFTFKTSDSVDKVVGFYKDSFGANGMKVTNSGVFTTGATTSGLVAAEDAGKTREAALQVGNQNGQTTVSVTWTEKK